MTDPTGTRLLRRAFLAEGNRRLGQVRSMTHTILVEHDLMQARDTPWAQLFPQPGHRLSAFAEWFSRTVDTQLLSMSWWEKYLQRAYDSGLVAGGELVGPPPGNQQPLPAVYSELARRELAGIAAALVQQVSRQAGAAALTRQKPQLMYRQVLTAIRKVGMVRLQMFVNYMTVKLHNAARLEQFRAAGVTQVGIIPERLVNPKLSRFLRHDHAIVHDQSAKRKLAALTAAAEELLARQRRQREEEQAKAEAELQAARKRLAAEIAAQMAGAPIPQSVAQAQLELRIAQGRARKEVEAAKAATAAQEAEAKAAWEKVLAARKEARAAEYAATRTAKTAAKTETPRAKAKAEEANTAAVGAQAKAVETEAKTVTQLLPKRLLAIGAEYVNSQTAGDDRVCIVCQDISAEGPYTLAQAQGMLPAHVDCRCAWVPAFDMRFKVNRVLAGEEEVVAAAE
jgi:hypothetical protein